MPDPDSFTPPTPDNDEDSQQPSSMPKLTVDTNATQDALLSMAGELGITQNPDGTFSMPEEPPIQSGLDGKATKDFINSYAKQRMDSAFNAEGRDVDYIAYIAVSGRNEGVYVPQHVWSARLFDRQGNLIWSSDNEPLVFTDGASHLGFYHGAAAVLAHVPSGATLNLCAPNRSTLGYPFGGEQRKYHHRNPKGQPFKDHEHIRAIDMTAMERGVVLTSSPPATEDEREHYAQASDDAKARREATEAASMQAEDKFGA